MESKRNHEAKPTYVDLAREIRNKIAGGTDDTTLGEHTQIELDEKLFAAEVASKFDTGSTGIFDYYPCLYDNGYDTGIVLAGIDDEGVLDYKYVINCSKHFDGEEYVGGSGDMSELKIEDWEQDTPGPVSEPLDPRGILLLIQSARLVSRNFSSIRSDQEQDEEDPRHDNGSATEHREEYDLPVASRPGWVGTGVEAITLFDQDQAIDYEYESGWNQEG